MLPLAFGELGAVRVEAAIDADNAPSRRVAEGAGFTEVGARGGRILYVMHAPPLRDISGGRNITVQEAEETLARLAPAKES